MARPHAPCLQCDTPAASAAGFCPACGGLTLIAGPEVPGVHVVLGQVASMANQKAGAELLATWFPAADKAALLAALKSGGAVLVTGLSQAVADAAVARLKRAHVPASARPGLPKAGPVAGAFSPWTFSSAGAVGAAAWAFLPPELALAAGAAGAVLTAAGLSFRAKPVLATAGEARLGIAAELSAVAEDAWALRGRLEAPASTALGRTLTAAHHALAGYEDDLVLAAATGSDDGQRALVDLAAEAVEHAQTWRTTQGPARAAAEAKLEAAARTAEDAAAAYGRHARALLGTGDAERTVAEELARLDETTAALNALDEG